MSNFKMVWIDIETGGLHCVKVGNKRGAEAYPILEIAVIVTDKDFNTIGEPFHTPIRLEIEPGCDPKDLVSEWSYNQFKDTLLKNCLDPTLPTLKKAQSLIINYLKELGVEKGKSPLCGNSVRLDRAFIEEQMPGLDNFLHYRIIDVSSFKEIAREVYDFQVDKKGSHSAIEDIEESIMEIKEILGRFHEGL